MTFSTIKNYFLAILILLIIPCVMPEVMAQSVGVGTTNPNSNAALDVVAPGNNQGVLLPRLTGGQRTSMSLGSTERGLIVYDTTDNLFYYWDGAQWIAGLGDSSGTFQNLAFNQATALLSIENGNSVDLSSLINDADSDPSNELITDVRLNGNILEIEENGLIYTLDLTPVINIGTDDQQLSLAGSVLTLEDGGAPIDLASLGYVTTSDDADADPTNEAITDFRITATDIEIEENGVLAGSIPLSGLPTGTDDQQISLAGSVLTLEDGGAPIDLASLGYVTTSDDADADPSNEAITDFRITATDIEIEENGVLAGSIPLSGLPTGTDDQEVTEFVLSGVNSSILQLTLEGDGTGQKTVDLHNISFPAASDLSGTIGTAVVKDGAINSQKILDGSIETADIQDGAVSNVKISDLDPSKLNQAGASVGDLLRWDGTQWAPATTAVVPVASYYSIDPSDFTGVYRQNFANSENNVLIFESDNSLVTIKDETLGRSIYAPVHLPHGSVVQSITMYFMDMHGPPVKLGLFERSFGSGQVDLGGGLNANENGPGIFTATLNGPFVIDNQNHTYMIGIDFNIAGITNQLSDAEQGIYGIVIEYITP
ncbi:hypothetical protein [Fulvivirga sedimenti]|uniref:Uncharacterized protein n=1 Tax=Fulvivirga sedimenti TaxID=2879465 RepID=A0A9X1HVN1_9BACT|nr:hypothetical protein [Fulvivirga sedimenti]MCA6074787.1 hypothetical protein [Fulvivirga sedimenti]MCA6075964.1 hypothetical protein [Fulvivirga sedimenti]MCA6077092.1 hypothetical protein [Fulvivirga sedimenti]